MKKLNINVLIFPGGSEIGLELNRALSNIKEVNIFSAGSNTTNHAPYVYKNHVQISTIHSKHWINELNNVISKWKIDYIYPAYDEIIVTLKENQTKIKARVIAPSLEVCQITRSKKLTCQRFRKLLPCPIVYASVESIAEYPVFLKPDRGQGSEGTQIANSAQEIKFYIKRNPDLLIMEYLPGKEYTIDCFSDQSSKLIFSGGRQRVLTRNGISTCSTLNDNPLWEKYARTISKDLLLTGAWFYQMKEDKVGKLKLLEIAPRASGTMALNRVRGINFPLLTLFQYSGLKVSAMINNYSVQINRALTSRYISNLKYQRAYVDLDDMLIINNQVNLNLIRLLYQMKNQDKEIILVTKHRENLDQTLKRFALSKDLFSKIIHIGMNDLKYKFINPKAAIFIDDSFSERVSIANEYKIPTFDNSMLEMLIDERV